MPRSAILNGIKVRRRVGKASARLVWIPLVTLSLFCATGLASHLGWVPTPAGLGDRPAARVSRAPPHEPARAAVRAAQPIPVASPAAPCPECEVNILAASRGRSGELAGAVAVWLNGIGVTHPGRLTSGDDRHAELIAWHACVRSAGACD